MSVAQCGIPYEIWDHIYAHLVDPYNFNKTRSFEEICRATRDIGVRWRYRKVHTSSPRFLCDIRRLAACEGKTESFPNGAYVRTLRVDADCTLECISDELRCSGSRSEELLAFVLSHMPNVQKLVADQVSGNFASDFPSNVFLSRGSRLLDAGWAAFGNNLQALELRTPFETLASILPHDLSLPNLHDLNFQFGTNPDRDFDDNEVDESLFWLQPFFSKHTPQLVSLAVSTHLLCDPSIVLEGIPSASKLRIFSFRSYYLPDDEEPTNRTFEFNGLERILTMSQGHLEELTLNWFPTLGSTWKLVGEDDPKYDAPWW